MIFSADRHLLWDTAMTDLIKQAARMTFTNTGKASDLLSKALLILQRKAAMEMRKTRVHKKRKRMTHSQKERFVASSAQKFKPATETPMWKLYTEHVHTVTENAKGNDKKIRYVKSNQGNPGGLVQTPRSSWYIFQF